MCTGGSRKTTRAWDDSAGCGRRRVLHERNAAPAAEALGRFGGHSARGALGGATDAQLDARDCRRVGRGADTSAPGRHPWQSPPSADGGCHWHARCNGCRRPPYRCHGCRERLHRRVPLHAGVSPGRADALLAVGHSSARAVRHDSGATTGRAGRRLSRLLGWNLGSGALASAPARQGCCILDARCSLRDRRAECGGPLPRAPAQRNAGGGWVEPRCHHRGSLAQRRLGTRGCALEERRRCLSKSDLAVGRVTPEHRLHLRGSRLRESGRPTSFSAARRAMAFPPRSSRAFRASNGTTRGSSS